MELASDNFWRKQIDPEANRNKRSTGNILDVVTFTHE